MLAAVAVGLYGVLRAKRIAADMTAPDVYVIPETGAVADRIEPPALARQVHAKVVQEFGHSSAGPQWIRWYLVREEHLEPPDGRVRVPHGGKTYAVHGWAAGDRIVLTPHGVTSADTIEHELRHVYGAQHDNHGRWEE